MTRINLMNMMEQIDATQERNLLEPTYTPTVVETTGQSNADSQINVDFLYAGKAIFTVAPSAQYLEYNSECKTHYTYQVTRKESTWNGRPSVTYFVALLSGPDNTADYTYMGMLLNDGGMKLTKASKYAEDSYPVQIFRRVAACLVKGEGAKIIEKGWGLHHEGRCGRCGRPLTVPESVEYGIGPECRKKMQGE